MLVSLLLSTASGPFGSKNGQDLFLEWPSFVPVGSRGGWESLLAVPASA